MRKRSIADVQFVGLSVRCVSCRYVPELPGTRRLTADQMWLSRGKVSRTLNFGDSLTNGQGRRRDHFTRTLNILWIGLNAVRTWWSTGKSQPLTEIQSPSFNLSVTSVMKLRDFLFVWKRERNTYYSAFTVKIEYNCHFPDPGRNCMTHSQELQSIHDTCYLIHTAVPFGSR